MKKVQMSLLVIRYFNNLVKEVKYNKFISDLWEIELLKDGVNLKLQIFNDSVLPVINRKSQSHISYEEVFPYIIGLYNLNNEINLKKSMRGSNHAAISSHTLNVS